MSKPNLPSIERRFVSDLELRSNGEGKMPTIVGYAARFNMKSVVMYDFREIIKPGAFTQSLARGDDVRALVEHSGGLMVLGRRSAGTLRVTEDDKGLRYEVDPPDTGAGRDIVTLIGRKDISQSSFGFRTVKANWIVDAAEGGMDVRELVQVDLFDVSPVAFPAYPDTEVSLRSAYYKSEKHEARAVGDDEIRRVHNRLRMAEAA